MKTCSQCQQLKSLDLFSKRASRKSGYRSECKSCQSENAREYFLSNRKRVLEHNRQYKKETNYNSFYTRRRYSNDLQFRLSHILRARLRGAMRTNQKAGSAIQDLGCSIKQLISHLEQQFQPGMAWENYGEWEIDHIKPLSSFDLTKRRDVKKACHFENLQPMWKVDNIRKSDRI